MTRNEPPGCLAFFLRLFRLMPAVPPAGATTPITSSVTQIVAPAMQPAPPSTAPVYNLAACHVRPYFMSKDETGFFHTLTQAVAGRYVILSKVGLGSLFDVPRLAEEMDWKTRGQFSQKHVDFLLCAPTDLKPVLEPV